jgi:hypothetical protein
MYQRSEYSMCFFTTLAHIDCPVANCLSVGASGRAYQALAPQDTL